MDTISHHFNKWNEEQKTEPTAEMIPNSIHNAILAKSVARQVQRVLQPNRS